MLSIVALIMTIIYSTKARKATDIKKQKNYRKGANIWGIVFLAVIAIEVLFVTLRNTGSL